MNEPYSAVIRKSTKKSIWSLKNVMDCVPDDMWDALYCDTPLYKHIYHTLHSLDRWYMNPDVYTEPDIHTQGLNDLNTPANEYLSRELLNGYANRVEAKITNYLDTLTDDMLNEMPDGCAYTRFDLILAQHRHLDMHIGMLMGYIIAKTGRWPKVLGLIGEISQRGQCEYD